MPTLRHCPGCGNDLPLDRFEMRTSVTGRRYPRGACKACRREQRGSSAGSSSGVEVSGDQAGRPHRRVRLCKLCAGYAHRVEPEVEGAHCSACGLAFKPLPPIRAVASRDASRVTYSEGNDYSRVSP